MAYSSEVLRRARQRLEQAREDKESQNRQRLEQAYVQLPRLQQIDRQLRQTMAEAARSAFVRGSDGVQAMEAIREANLALQQERRALIAGNFPAGYLDESPVCGCCGGTGYVGSTMCECLKELCRQEQRKELTLLHMGKESFDQFRLDFYPDWVDSELGIHVRTLMGKTFTTCRNYAHSFSTDSPNLLFSGGTGLGKTFLSACIARTVSDSGFSVVYESAAHLFGKLERAKFDSDEDARAESEKFTACDLLIVDDLGTEMAGQFTTSALYTLLNDRLLSGKPTIISTNLNTEDLTRRYSPQIASRLNGSFLRVPFVGEDIRVKKNWGSKP